MFRGAKVWSRPCLRWVDMAVMSGAQTALAPKAEVHPRSCYVADANSGHCRHSRNGTLWNIGRDRADHSTLMLAARITLPHFSISSAMSLP
jgi:hypothetical protein